MLVGDLKFISANRKLAHIKWLNLRRHTLTATQRSLCMIIFMIICIIIFPWPFGRALAGGLQNHSKCALGTFIGCLYNFTFGELLLFCP